MRALADTLQLSNLNHLFGSANEIVNSLERCTIAVVLIIILAIFSMFLAYRRGVPLFVRIAAIFQNTMFSVWPRWPFVHSTSVIVMASVGVFLVFIPLTNELIVNVTAVYATILFLEGTLRKKVPLIGIEFIRPTSTPEFTSELVDGDRDDEVVKQLIEIENYGDDTADNVLIKYRAICTDGSVTQPWKNVDLRDDDSNDLAPNESFQRELYVDTVDEYEDQVYLLEVIVKPNVRLGHLVVRKINRMVPE